MTTPPFHPFRSEQAKAEFQALYLEKAEAWPVPSETRLVDTPSGRTFVRASGALRDPPLVLLPGARGTSLMWAPIIAALSEHRRTYALDTVTDIGLSVWRAEIPTPEALVTWLHEVLTVLAPESPLDLMGCSYGGWLTARYSLRFPHRVRKAVLLAPAATVLPMSFAFIVRVLLIALPFPGRAKGPVERMLRWLFQDLVRRDERAHMPTGPGIADVLDIVRMDRFFALPWMTWPTVIDDESWRKFSVPALFVVGENEKIYSPRAAVRRLNHVAPHVKTAVIPGAGHDLVLVQSDLVAEKVVAFLDEAAP